MDALDESVAQGKIAHLCCRLPHGPAIIEHLLDVLPLGRVEVVLEENESGLRLIVRDEGLGIPHGEQQRIFGKFYRVDPQQSRGVGGTGLGLYICRELVRRMKGRVSVTSSDGKGSIFVVELPLASPPQRQSDSQVAQTA